MLVAYRQHIDQRGASSLQNRTENNKMPVACRQHREQRDASSLQRGNIVFSLTDNTENNGMLVPYRTGQRTTK